MCSAGLSEAVRTFLRHRLVEKLSWESWSLLSWASELRLLPYGTFSRPALSNLTGETARAVAGDPELAATPRSRKREPATPPGPREPIEKRTEDEDWEIVRAVQQGASERFSVLVRKYQDRIFSVVSRILSSPLDAEEVANDAFVAAYRKIASFRGDARFSSWLYRIATNLALNRVKKVKRRNVETSIEAMVEETGDHVLAKLESTFDSPVKNALA